MTQGTRARYTHEFKLEAVRLVKSGHGVVSTGTRFVFQTG